MNFKIITLFPEAFTSYLEKSIIGRAIADKKIKVGFFNPRDFEKNEKLRVDDKPYGGGPGMVLRAEPFIKAIKKAKGKNTRTKIIYLERFGKQFTQDDAIKLSKQKNLVIVCGRYEGIDARVRKSVKGEIYSIGPYILTGGELPAMTILDSVSRQVEGVMGSFDSREESRVASPEVYTRPEEFSDKNKKYKVPKVLLSGNHKKIEEWRESIWQKYKK